MPKLELRDKNIYPKYNILCDGEEIDTIYDDGIFAVGRPDNIDLTIYINRGNGYKEMLTGSFSEIGLLFNVLNTLLN